MRQNKLQEEIKYSKPAKDLTEIIDEYSEIPPVVYEIPNEDPLKDLKKEMKFNRILSILFLAPGGLFLADAASKIAEDNIKVGFISMIFGIATYGCSYFIWQKSDYLLNQIDKKL